MDYKAAREHFLKLLQKTGKATITKPELRNLCNKHGIKIPQWFTKDETNRMSRGVFKVPGATITTETHKQVAPKATAPVNTTAELTPRSVIRSLVTTLEEQSIIPEHYKNYVPFGNFEDLKTIIESKMFCPVFITGLSGNGKSMAPEQACAQLRREYIHYSMTPETDETDLLGGYVLINNDMVWRDGPVTIAARRGAILCIDEIDFGAQNLATLQRVLEGKPFLLKKKGEVVHPAHGFNVIVTANTKGKGSESGRYMYTNILNEAFLERFPIMFEQEWPPANIEKRILKKELESAGKIDDDFVSNLVTWANTIRKAFEDGVGDEVVSTRRLVQIITAFPIFESKIKAITYCLNRFDNDTKKSFLDLYSKLDSSVVLDNRMESQKSS